MRGRPAIFRQDQAWRWIDINLPEHSILAKHEEETKAKEREIERLRGELHVAKNALNILTGTKAEPEPTMGDRLSDAFRANGRPLDAYGRRS